MVEEELEINMKFILGSSFTLAFFVKKQATLCYSLAQRNVKCLLGYKHKCDLLKQFLTFSRWSSFTRALECMINVIGDPLFVRHLIKPSILSASQSHKGNDTINHFGSTGDARATSFFDRYREMLIKSISLWKPLNYRTTVFSNKK